MSRTDQLPRLLLLGVTAVLIWSASAPHDRLTWWMEAAPVLVALPLLALTYRRFPLTDLLYICIAAHGIILLVGAHYTYAEVPLGDWMRNAFHLSRNHYDRLGHFAQGFVPALIARELLLRTSPLKSGKWLTAIILLSCLGISAAYEIIEWIGAETLGQSADAFLGTQGDIWDMQKDMALALLGAMVALLFLSRAHDRALARLT